MTISRANHCTCPACVSIHAAKHILSLKARGGHTTMHREGYDAEGKCVAAVNRGELGDLLSIEH